jgi:hypothetical protein
MEIKKKKKKKKMMMMMMIYTDNLTKGEVRN